MSENEGKSDRMRKIDEVCVNASVKRSETVREVRKYVVKIGNLSESVMFGRV